MQSNSSSYLILYQLNTNNSDSKGFIRCKSLQQTFNTITKLAIYLYQNYAQKSRGQTSQNINKENSNNFSFSLKQLINILKKIPYIKVYQSQSPNSMSQLKETTNFHKKYRQHIISLCKQTEMVYKLIMDATESDQYIKMSIHNIRKNMEQNNISQSQQNNKTFSLEQKNNNRHLQQYK